MPSFSYMIVCRSGVFIQGSHPDFLVAIVRARRAKQRAQRDLPNSRFRVQLCNPNGERVSSEDLRAALRALSNEKVMSAVVARLAAAVALRSGAAAADGRDFSSGSATAFCQAGVVAPPDSLTGETRPVFGSAGLAG